MDNNNKFKPISRPTYNGNQSGAGPYSRPAYNNKPQYNAPQQSSQQEYQQPQENYQEEYQAPTSSYTPSRKKRPMDKKVIFGIIGVVAVVAIVIALFTFGGKESDVSKVENIFDNDTVGTTSSLLGDTTATGTFNGSAVEVPWPSDITPTKMEINLDPTTGDPVLMLVGEKSGVGTVIRSYNKSGALTGFWVIVSSDPALTDTTGTGTVTGTTPTLEQTIATEVHSYLAGKIDGLSKEDIIKNFNTELTATATKYGKTVENVVDYYISAIGKTN